MGEKQQSDETQSETNTAESFKAKQEIRHWGLKTIIQEINTGRNYNTKENELENQMSQVIS